MSGSRCRQVVTISRRIPLWIGGERRRMTVPDAIRTL